MFDASADVYRQLAKELGEEVRAVLALEMMYQEQGDADEVENWLEQTLLCKKKGPTVPTCR